MSKVSLLIFCSVGRGVNVGRQQRMSICDDLLRLKSSVINAGNTNKIAIKFIVIKIVAWNAKALRIGIGSKAAPRKALAVEAPLNKTLRPYFLRICAVLICSLLLRRES